MNTPNGTSPRPNSDDHAVIPDGYELVFGAQLPGLTLNLFAVDLDDDEDERDAIAHAIDEAGAVTEWLLPELFTGVAHLAEIGAAASRLLEVPTESDDDGVKLLEPAASVQIGDSLVHVYKYSAEDWVVLPADAIPDDETPEYGAPSWTSAVMLALLLAVGTDDPEVDL